MQDTLLTPHILLALLANGRTANAQPEDERFDPVPVLKITLPGTAAIWLLTEADPHNPDLVFGLCDLGLGFPELGWSSLTEIATTRGPAGQMVERNETFHTAKTIKVYAAEAVALGRIDA